MTSFFTSDYNAVNLFRNGGLDFVKPGSTTIPFWQITGAAQGAIPPDNNYEIIVSDTQEAENGAARYFKFFLSSDDPVTLLQDFSDRFIQMGFVKELGETWNEKDRLEHDRAEWEANPLRYATYDCLFIRETPITLAFSLRVPQGRASLKLAAVPSAGADIESTIQSGVFSKDWLRPVKATDFGYRRIRQLKIVLTRDPGAGSTEVQIGALMLSPGMSSSLPYTGDPMADAFPENTVVMAFGSICPPGFERLEFVAPVEIGRIFPKGGAYASTTVVGEETHDHSGARVTMNPERNWLKTAMIPADQSGNTRGDDGSAAHEHPKDFALHVPPTKDVILCKRISWNQGA